MIRIGITGHRPHRLKVSDSKLSARVASVLIGLMKADGKKPGSSTPCLDIISPLAEGCDRIVARQALALQQRLTALLPFERGDYEATFGDASTTTEFRALWKASSERAVLKGLAKHAEASYVAVGMVTLARCDVVLTIWDGKPAAGRGGTPEILQNALEWGIPIIWIDALKDRNPVVLRAKARGKKPPLLDRVAQKTEPLTAALYREISIKARGTTSA